MNACSTENGLPRRVAAVLPRYGQSLGGGAETLVRELLLALGRSGTVDRIEVWTTCARDHRTWENEYPEGTTFEDGFPVSRFTVDPRNLDVFVRAEIGIGSGRPLPLEEQLDWLQAGVNARGLYSHIAAHAANFDAILFAPYLFPTSFWGPLVAPKQAILIPCLHNESYAYLPVFSHVFRSVRGCLFNALPELSLASEIFTDAHIVEKSGVVGMGFDLPPLGRPESAAGAARPHPRPYLLYSGRKERGKNLDLLIDWYVASRPELGEIDLLLIGSGSVDFLERLPDGVYDLGFVSEAEKLRIMAGALALCQLSTNESFSIVMMEAWAQQVPIVVHAHGAVPRHHVIKSGGGLYASSAREFLAVVQRLQHDPALCRALGEAGRSYVAREYSWSSVLGRWAETFQRIDEFHRSSGEAAAVDSGTVNSGTIGVPPRIGR